mgnify:FL=1|tara:strand:+ start:249 stop:533 length:285 start_codon:yes stop_codon:yes gene_type:complete
MKRITSHGSKRLAVSEGELITIETLAKAILRNAQRIREESDCGLLQDLYLEITFTRAQAIADYSKAASKRLGRKPRRDDFLNLVEQASETVDYT